MHDLFDSTTVDYVGLLQNLAAGYGTGNNADDQQQQRRLYAAIIHKQQQQQQQLELAVQLAVERLARERSGGYSNPSGTGAGSAVFSPSSTCSMTVASLSASASTSPSSAGGDAAAVSPTAQIGAQIFGDALPYLQQQQQRQKFIFQAQQQQHNKICTGERKRWRLRLVGNLDNTLDGLVAKRLDANPQAGGLRRYRTEKEAIELPDDEAEMRRMAADPDVSTRQCSVCGYQGKWVSEMIRHKRVHTSERPFRCRLCNRTSKWKADLIRHVAKTHGIRVVSKYSRSKTFAAGANSNKSATINLNNNDHIIIDKNSDNGTDEFVVVDENNNNNEEKNFVVEMSSDLVDCTSTVSSEHCDAPLAAGAAAVAAPLSVNVDLEAEQQQILISLVSTILQQQQNQDQQKQNWLHTVLQDQQQQQQLRLSLLLDRQSESQPQPMLALGGLYSQLLAMVAQQQRQQQ